MGKILYLTTNKDESQPSDPAITARLASLAAPIDIDVRHIIDLRNIDQINTSDYSLVIFDPNSSIPPWKIINQIRELSGKKPTPSFWIESDLNTITKHYLQSEGMTGSVLVTKDSGELISACNGNVDGQLVSDASKIGINTQHNICSIGKILTGLTVLKLIQEGKLKIDDRISNYLPDSFPNKDKFAWTRIRQLVTHTSAMGNYTRLYDETLNDAGKDNPHFNNLSDFSPFIEHDLSVKLGQFRYSNVGFVVLGEILEQVINKDIKVGEPRKTYWDAINDYILKPAGITITRDTPLPDLPFATNTKQPFKNTINIASSPAGANMWATPESLAKFGDWLSQQILTDPMFMNQLNDAKARMYKDEDFFYSFGMMMGKNKAGQEVFYHNGGAPGIGSHLHVIPAANTTEVVFINNDDSGRDLASHVAMQIETNVVIANHIYYADPKFSDDPDELFKQAAKEAGFELTMRQPRP